MNLVAKGKRNPGPTRYAVNVRLLLMTVIFLAVALPAVYFWHGYSVTRISQAFLDQANKLIEEADNLESEPEKAREAAMTLNKAVDLIWQFRRARPDDQPSSVLMAKTFDRSSQGRSGLPGRRRTARFYAEAIALTSGPEVAELKTALGDIMLETADFAEAERIGQQLIDLANGPNPDANAAAAGSRIYAVALFGQLNQGTGRRVPADLGEAFATAIEKNPTDTTLPVLLAAIYRDKDYRSFLSETQRQQLTDANSGFAQKADEIVDEMVQRNESSATAYLQRYSYQTQLIADLTADDSSEIEDRKRAAERDLNRALEIDPADPIANLSMGRFLQNQFRDSVSFRQGKSADLSPDQQAILEKARRHFETCSKKLFEGRLGLGEVQSVLGFPDEALKTFSSTINYPDFSTTAPSFQISIRQRSISLLIELNRLDEAQQQLNTMNEYIESLRKRNADPKLIADFLYLQDFLSGYLRYEQQAYGDAVAILEKRLPDPRQPVSPWTLDVIRLLGGLYMELDQPMRAADIYQIGVGIDRSGNEFSFRLSQALSRAQRFDLSADALSSLARNSDSADVWLEYAFTLLQQELRKPFQVRNLGPTNIALQKAREFNQIKSTDRPWRLDVVQLQTILASSSRPLADPGSNSDLTIEFDTIASRLESDFGDETEVLKELAAVYQLAGRDVIAQRIIQKYEIQAGDVPERFVFVAGLQTGKGKFDAAHQTLDDGLSRVSDQEKLPLQLAKVNLLLSQGKYTTSITELESLIVQNPDSPELIVNIAELLIQLPYLIQPQPAEWEGRLPDIEGKTGPLASMIAAHRLLLQFEKTEDLNDRAELLKQAQALCSAIKLMRPNWAPVYSLYGLVMEMYQNVSIQQSRINQQVALSPEAERIAAEQKYPAKRSYQLAIELGERRPFVLMRLADMEADPVARRNVLARFDQGVVASNPDLSNMHMASLVAGNDLENAVKVAELATRQRPADPSAWIARARVELINGSVDDSMQSIETARSLLDDSSDPLLATLDLFRFYTSVDDFQASDEFIQQSAVEARALIPGILERTGDNLKLLLHAELLDALNDVAANDLFLQAISKSPDDTAVLERSLQYFASADQTSASALNQAIDIADRLVKIDSSNTQYVQFLVGLLSRRGTAGDFKKIAELLNGKVGNDASSVGNQRIMAILLLTRVDVPNSERLANLQQAWEIVRSGNSATDLVLAGQILRTWAQMMSGDAEENSRKQKLVEAEDYFKRAMAATDIGAPQLVMIADFFIEQGATDSQKWDVADSVIQKLNKLAFSSILDNVPVISLTARLRHARGVDSPESVNSFVEEYGLSVEQASKTLSRNVRAQLFQQIADIFGTIDAKDQALVWREKAANLDTNQQLRLAFERARNGKLDEALQQCIDGYEETGELKFAIAIAEFLVTENGNSQQYQQAENVFNSALEDHSDDLNLLLSIGNARIAGQDRVQDAIDLYQKALQIEPGNQVLLNNLATAWSELPENLPDALRTIDLAISLHGNRTGLLDTKAVILMLKGDLPPAEQILSNIVNTNSDSRFWWHLAEVQWKLYEQSGKPDDLQRAQTSFDKSIGMGLEKEILTPGEKKRLSTLKDNLASRKVGARSEAVNLLMSQFAPRSERVGASCLSGKPRPCCNGVAVAPQIIPNHLIVINS